MRNTRNPSPAKWAYMKEMGKVRYILSRMWWGAATYLMVTAIIVLLVPAHVLRFHVVALLLNWVHTTTFLFAVLAGFRAWYYWRLAEASEALHQPTIHTPRFEGDVPAKPRSGRKSA